MSQPLKSTGPILFHTSLLYKLSPRFRSRFAFSLGLPFPYLERAGICRRMRTIGKAKKLLLVLRMHCGYKNKNVRMSSDLWPPNNPCSPATNCGLSMTSGSQLQVAKFRAGTSVPEPPCRNLRAVICAGTSVPEPPSQNLCAGTSGP